VIEHDLQDLSHKSEIVVCLSRTRNVCDFLLRQRAAYLILRLLTIPYESLPGGQSNEVFGRDKAEAYETMQSEFN
jgi:hypothetical protein